MLWIWPKKKEKKEDPGGGELEEREGLCVPVFGGSYWCCAILLTYPPLCLPLFLFLIHRNSARSKCHHQQQTADDRGGLEEVVLEKIVHGLVGGDGPESVEVDIDNQEPQDEGQRCKFGFETDGHQDDEGSPNHVLQDLWDNAHVKVGG